MKITEAFISITLVGVFLLLFISQESQEIDSFEERVYAIEESILMEIGFDNSLRSNILSANLPVEWDEFDSNLLDVKTFIMYRVPNYLVCEAILCDLNSCKIDESKEIYVKSRMISANSEVYSPRQLKIYCWERRT